MFVITQEARDAQDAAVAKAGHMAAGAFAVPGVPSGAEGRIGRQQENVTEPAAPHRPAVSPARMPDYLHAEDFRRPLISAGHAADSPANVSARPDQVRPGWRAQVTGAGPFADGVRNRQPAVTQTSTGGPQ